MSFSITFYDFGSCKYKYNEVNSRMFKLLRTYNFYIYLDMRNQSSPNDTLCVSMLDLLI